MFDFKNHTHIMAVLNVTPDSFSGDGICSNSVIDRALKQAESFVKAGCHILDIGGESTRPGATPVSLQEELDRVIPIIQAIHKNFDVPISIDTMKAIVADQAVKCGASVINDVSGLLHDPEMVHIAAKHQCYTVIMHSFNAGIVEKTILGGRYIKKDVDESEDIIVCIYRDLDKQVIFALENGVDPSKIILDPGIGFGKTVEQNIEIMARFDEIPKFRYPVLLGASRKSFIGYTVNAPVDKRLGGSLAALTVGIMKGAQIVRVHDVEESAQAAKIVDAIMNYKN
ncbi:MAG: dihydropteroate synthase [Alphaproteobacteria bacterium]|jgi:dihydropteroate synthase|nr:dihydropteroate synthase [Alphaproteobacteria bacterium]